MPGDSPRLISLLQRGMDSAEGTELTLSSADDVRLLRAKLYAVRRENPEYQVLSFIQRGSKLYIIKREATYDDPIGGEG